MYTEGWKCLFQTKLLSLESVSEHVTIFKAGHTVLTFPWFPDTEL